MDERIRIEFEALGLDSMMSNAKELEATLRTLSGKKAINFRDSSIKDLRRDLDRIKNFKLRLSVARTNELARIRREIQALRDTKVTLQTDYSKATEGIKAYQRQISAIKKELKSLELKGELTKSMRNSLNGMIGGLTRAKNSLEKNFEKTWGIPLDYDRYIGKMMTDYVNPMLQKQNERAHAKEYFDEMERQANEASANIKTHLSEIKNMDITPRFNVEKLYSTIRNFQMRLGSSMQSIGNGLSRLTSSVDYLLRGSLYTMAYKGINMITEGLSGATERYDIMERYPDIIAAMGGSAKVAKGEVQKLYNAVLGLPTGLDTIVDAQKQYFLALQGGYKDQNKALKRASDIAIAANNAFVAGGASEEQIIFGQRQLRDLLSAGKLRNQEWQSLAKAIPNAMSAIQKDLGVSRSDIMGGQVSADKFINSLLKVASAGGPVAKAAEKMKHTFTAVQSNIRNALRNAGYEGIKALDEILIAYNGKDVIDNLLGIKPYIQDIAKDIQDWAKANPDKITDFFEKIKSIDIKGFLSGVASAFGNIIKLVGAFSGALSSLGGSTLGKMLIYGNFLGKFLSGFGGIIRGTAGVNAGLFTGIAFLASRLVNFFKTTETASKLAKISIVDKIANFFKRFKTVEKAATGTAGASGFKAVNRKLAKTGAEATELATTTATMSTSLKQVGANLLKSIAPAITIGAYVGVFWGAVKAIENISKSEINFDKLIANLTYTMTGIASIMGVMRGISTIAFRGTIGTAVVTAIKDVIANLSMLITAGTFTALTKLTSIISSIRINPDRLAMNLENVIASITVLTAFSTALGAVYVVPIGGQVLALMTAIGDIAALLTAGAWLAVTKALDRIAKLDIPDENKIEEITGALQSLIDGLLSKPWYENVGDMLEIGDVKTTIDDLEKISEDMSKIIGRFGNIIKSIQALEKSGISKEQISKATDVIGSIKDGIWEVFTAVDEFFGIEQEKRNAENISRSYWGDEDNSKRFEQYNEALTQAQAALTAFNGISSKIMSLQGVMNKLKEQFGTVDTSDTWIHDPIGAKGKGTGQVNTSPITSMISGFVQMINAITDSENGLGALQNAVKRMENINLDNIKAQLDKIPQVIDTLTQLKNKLSMNTWLTQGYEVPSLTGGMMGGALGGGGATEMGTKTNFTGGVGEMLNTIKKFVEVMVQINTELSKVPDISANATLLKSGIDKLKTAVTAMTGLKTAIAADAESGTSMDTVATTISTYISKLNTALMNVPLMVSNAMQFQLAINTMKAALDSITNGGEGSITNFITQLEKIPGALQKVNDAMRGRGKAWKEELIDGFKGAKKAILDEVRSIARSLNGAGFGAAGASAGSRFASAFNSAASAIRIPTIPFPGGGGGGWSTGGLITPNGAKYMSKGGIVRNGFPGRPKGIDTVPIWAATGEYMMNRNAVSAFGVKFMQRINNLDLKGAIASLGVRGGQLAYATPTTVIDRSKHITYNNNQQLTMNNNNASQGYSEIRASRYLRNM